MRWLAGLAFGLMCGAAVDAGARPSRAAADLARLAAHESYAHGPGLAGWAGRAPRGAPEADMITVDRAQFDADAYEISLRRDWDEAVRFEAGSMDLALTPHLGLGLDGQAEAGAVLTLSRGGKTLDRLRALGFDDGRTLGDQGRWFLFAAASGRAVGLSLMGDEGRLDQAGWTTDATSTLVSNAQLGLGWRKGDVQTSFGYLHREVKGRHMTKGRRTGSDEMLGLSLSVKPAR